MRNRIIKAIAAINCIIFAFCTAMVDSVSMVPIAGCLVSSIGILWFVAANEVEINNFNGGK